MGKSVVEKLAADLNAEFPEQKGFSPQNLWFMRQCYEELSGHPNLLQLARELPNMMPKDEGGPGQVSVLGATFNKRLNHLMHICTISVLYIIFIFVIS